MDRFFGTIYCRRADVMAATKYVDVVREDVSWTESALVLSSVVLVVLNLCSATTVLVC